MASSKRNGIAIRIERLHLQSARRTSCKPKAFRSREAAKLKYGRMASERLLFFRGLDHASFRRKRWHTFCELKQASQSFKSPHRPCQAKARRQVRRRAAVAGAGTSIFKFFFRQDEKYPHYWPNLVCPHIAMCFFVFLAPSRLLRRLLLRLLHHPHNTINTTSSTQYHQHNTTKKTQTPSTQHHQHINQQITINTTPPTHHHQHTTINTNIINTNIINTSPTQHHHQHRHHQHKHHQHKYHQHKIHQHITINTSPTQHHRDNIINTSPSTHTLIEVGD